MRTACRRGARACASVAAIASALLALTVATGGMAGAASTATTVITATVNSSTLLNSTGCAAGTSSVTDLGSVMPGSSTVSTADCAVVFGSNNDTSMLRAYQTDTAGTAMFGMSNGTLDTTFDTDGKQTAGIGAGSDYGYGMALQSDGKIVVSGGAFGANSDFAVARFTTAGALDATFDTDGKVTTAIGSVNDYGMAVAIQPDGKIVVGGYAWNGTDDDFAVVRYNTNGSLDATFDGDGIATTAIGTSADRANAVLIQPDGRIVLVGTAVFGGVSFDYALVRYNTNGSLDTSFDTDGKVTTAIGGTDDTAKGAALQSDGKIVAAGYTSNATGDLSVARYNADGSLDTGFDGDGKAVIVDGASAEEAAAVAIQPDGKIVLGGTSANDFAAWRYGTGGALDATFDGDGKQTTAVGPGVDYGKAVLVQPDGMIVVAGLASNGANNDFAILRYTSAGALHSGFDGDGKQTTALGAGADDGAALAMQTDGKLLVGGNAAMANVDFALVRYAGGGTVADWSGSWGAAGLFASCLHTVANATNTWTLAGSGNCTTAIDANWNALPTTASKIAWAGSGVVNGTANLRYGFKTTAGQAPGNHVAPLTFEVVAPNA